jgi:hypothetical protein
MAGEVVSQLEQELAVLQYAFVTGAQQTQRVAEVGRGGWE